MGWFNPYGLIFMAVLMIPNIIFAIRRQDEFENAWKNKAVDLLEQIGRFGCFALMIFNIPGTWFGFYSDTFFAIYLIADSVLVLLYCLIWIVCFKRSTVFRALALSILPSMLFLFSALMSRSLLLLAAALVFAPSHITISYKSAALWGHKR